MPGDGPRRLLVPTSRVVRWCDNFTTRHGAPAYSISGGALSAVAEDGTSAELRLPFDRPYDGAPAPHALVLAAASPASWGVLLVRKGGFAVARMTGRQLVEHKIGQRHVQGRTKAGGQSQQRFARRRDNQARAAYDAAADHAARLLVGPLEALVCGGDRTAVAAVLSDVRLASVAAVRVSRWLPTPDPRRTVLDEAVQQAGAVEVVLSDP